MIDVAATKMKFRKSRWTITGWAAENGLNYHSVHNFLHGILKPEGKAAKPVVEAMRRDGMLVEVDRSDVQDIAA